VICLLWKRGEEIAEKRNEFQRLADEANAEMRSVLDFAEAYSKDAELRKSACVACGGTTGPGDTKPVRGLEST
jgi:hypothetical protein